MFERFTNRARRVIAIAQDEARALNHAYIGTEHLLLGIISEAEGGSHDTLTRLGIEYDAVQAHIREIIGLGMHRVSGYIQMTPRAKKSLELASHQSLRLRSNDTTPSHILLGLIEQEGVATQILAKLGLSSESIRLTVLRELGVEEAAAPDVTIELPLLPDTIVETFNATEPIGIRGLLIEGVRYADGRTIVEFSSSVMKAEVLEVTFKFRTPTGVRHTVTQRLAASEVSDKEG